MYYLTLTIFHYLLCICINIKVLFSFIKNRKSNGPKTDPWGIQAFNSYNHLHINKLLYKFQSGFLLGFSTTHQLIELYDTILLSATSFIKNRKSNGPKTDPWGIQAFNSPVLVYRQIIVLFPYCHVIVRF
jgi:hypothetical protein